MERVLLVYEKILRKIGLEKFGNLIEIIRINDGPVNSLKKLTYYDDLKKGTLVGTDEFGNRYYNNNYYFFGRNRWVEYADHVGFNYDGSQVPPEWYGWLHYKTDYLPENDPTRPNYPWVLKPSENLTGTKAAYMCYSTTKPKIVVWTPQSKQKA
ncbi:hypothetical protein PGB90_005304 [Kerria lacca]